MEGHFHVKTRRFVGSSNRKPHTYHVKLWTRSCTYNKTPLLGFSHIFAACHCQLIDFWQFVQGYYTTQAYLSTWAPLFYPIFNELEWPQYNELVIVHLDWMKRLIFGWQKSSCLHNKIDARETKTPQTCGLYKQLGHNWRSCPNKETTYRRSWCTSWTSYCTVIFLFTSIDLNHFKIAGPQALSILRKPIVIRKDAYPNIIMHSPKPPRKTQGEFMDVTNPLICQQSLPNDTSGVQTLDLGSDATCRISSATNSPKNNCC